METKKVILKPIIRNNWAGVSRYDNCTDTIIASLGRGGYATGLNAETQARLEKSLQMKEGELGPYSDFWKEYALRISNRIIEFDLDKAQDELDYWLCMNSFRVAKNPGSINTKNDYVLIDAEEDAKTDVLKIEQETEAIVRFSKMTVSDMRNYLKLIGKNPIGTSDNLIKTTVKKEIDNDPIEFLRIYNPESKEFNLKIFVKDLEYANILRKQGISYYYGDKSNILGNGVDEVVSFLKNKKNNEVYATLKSKLEAFNDK